jgi:hypothetical protein
MEFISASVTQREDFSKDGRERFRSKGCTLALKVFLTQTSSSTKWQEEEKDVQNKREQQVQLSHPKKDKLAEIHQVLLPDETNVKENQVLFAKLVPKEIMEMQTSIPLLMYTMPMTMMYMLSMLRTITMTMTPPPMVTLKLLMMIKMKAKQVINPLKLLMMKNDVDVAED